MKEAKNSAVVIPFYKTGLTKLEEISLKQCFKILGNYPIVVIKPSSLDLSAFIAQYPFSKIESFDDQYFDGIQGYNRLLLSAEFYRRFLAYEFMLIHQLDVFVFKDEFTRWATGKYDYIGAPWIREIDDPDIFKAIKTRFQILFHKRFNVVKNGLPSPKQFENQVGNGGFSLRRVQKFFQLCTHFEDLISLYNLKKEHQFHEDAFWSIEVNRSKKMLEIPDYKVALQFAFENSPTRAYRLNGNNLPFGCHAWDKNLSFWRPFIEAEGYCDLL